LSGALGAGVLTIHVQAYELVEQAEKLVQKGQYNEASLLHRKASEAFKPSIGVTANKEINRALELLVEQHATRARELALLENIKGVKQTGSPLQNSFIFKQPDNNTNNNNSNNNNTNNTNNNSISTSLASARGIQNVPQNVPSLENMISNGSMILTGTPPSVGDDMDPLTKFQIQVYNLIKAPNLSNNMIETPTDKTVKKSGKSVEELEIENQMLKQLVVSYSENLQVYESFHKKVKNNLRNYLNTLKKDLQGQELAKRKEYETKVEALKQDKKKLETQIKKLKQRWDELVESAKKRREDSQKDNKS
jgi:hypothetical protein